MPLAALISGGKDSLHALYSVLRQGREVRYLVAMLPEREDSWLFHFPNIRLVDLVAEAMGIPLVKRKTTGVKGIELKDLERTVRGLDIDGIVCGAISSEYQQSAIEGLCHRLGIDFLAPLWGKDPIPLLRKMVRLKFDILITGVAAYGFDESWLGRKIDDQAISDLADLSEKFGIHPSGEGGEYETLVLDSPMFKKRIDIIRARRSWKPYSGYLFIDEARLVKKASSS